MRSLSLSVLVVPIFGLLFSACGNDTASPTQVQQSFGTSVTANDAIPAPAVAAEPDRYRGRPVTIDGRITARGDNGCTLQLHTAGGSPLRIEAVRTDDGTCAWQVPTSLDGIAAATGTLHTENDTLRLSANGVQVTPLQQSGANSSP